MSPTRSFTTPLEAAWNAQGHVDRPPSQTPGNVCARCASTTAHHRSRDVISAQFTAFDDWNDPRGKWLCGKCTWALTTPELRQTPWEITDVPTCKPIADSTVTTYLAFGPLPHTTSLLIPLQPGRQHLITAARWGHIAIDNVCLPWSTQDAQRFQSLTRLRQQGFGPRMLTEPAPSFTIMRKLPPNTWASVTDDWNQLRVWRTPKNPWLALATRITRGHA